MLHEREKHRWQWVTVGADNAYDTQDFMATARQLNVTVRTQRTTRPVAPVSTVEPQGTPGYARSLSRWLIEKTFGWLKETERYDRSSCAGWPRSTRSSSPTARPTTCSPPTAARDTSSAGPSATVRLKTGVILGTNGRRKTPVGHVVSTSGVP